MERKKDTWRAVNTPGKGWSSLWEQILDGETSPCMCTYITEQELKLEINKYL